MEEQLRHYIGQHGLFGPSDRILVAVSGGVDSVVLCHLLKGVGVSFGVAHCNFQLRGEDSELDAAFVKKLANQLGVRAYQTQFETEQLAATAKTSIQLLARKLRYDWLGDIRKTEGFDYIATAHHTNDSIETALYNFAKGSGIRGIRGMLPKNRSVIHPLLFADKDMIEQYAAKHDIAYRADASNATDKYTRNKIRHHILPVLKDINPSLEKTARQTFGHLRDVETLYLWAVESIRKEVMQETETATIVDLKKLFGYPAFKTILFELLKPYSFNNAQVAQLLGNDHSGTQFFSGTHRLVLNRGYCIIESIADRARPRASVFDIHQHQHALHLPDGHLTITYLDEAPIPIPSAANTACFDRNALHFPLTLRRWQPGDQFQPFGMNGQHKKVQDFFTDKKLSLIEKEHVWIMESNGVICWIVNHRMDERFRINEETQQVVLVSWEN